MGMAHPALDPRVLRDAGVLGWSRGCVCAWGASGPFPRARQRRDGVCELDFTRHQMRCSWLEIGSRSSFLLAPSSSPLLPPPSAGGWADNMEKRLLPCKPLCPGSHLQARRQFALMFT